MNVVNKIASSITTEFLNPNSIQSLSIMKASSVSPLHSLFKYINVLAQFFVIIGVFSILLKDRMKFKNEYLAFMSVNILLLFITLTIPHFSNALDTARLYQITLIFLSPAWIIGGLTFLTLINEKIIKKFKIQIDNFTDKSIIILSTFLVVFLLFNTGFIYYLFSDDSTFIALNSTFDTAKYDQQEIYGADWLYNHGTIPILGIPPTSMIQV